ncbi:hypothetical protein [Paenibacillus ginsengarvi]|nr:hypothetical protein [Paenibacillus ginsengarvi]
MENGSVRAITYHTGNGRTRTIEADYSSTTPITGRWSTCWA